MKTKQVLKLSVLGLLVCGLSASALAGNFGTDILHLTSTTTMTTGAESNAVGTVTLMQKTQGNADHQSLQIRLGGLEPNGIYVLSALIGTDTNLTDVTVVNPNTNGDASLLYQTKGNGNGNGHGGSSLPNELNPVSSIQGLVLLNSSNQVVLTADLTAPHSLQYLLKQNLSTNSVSALLTIHATQNQLQFDLMSSGLLATNNYLLVVNGTVDQTVETDTKGRLKVKSLVNPPASALDIQSLMLWDSSSNVVYSATLP